MGTEKTWQQVHSVAGLETQGKQLQGPAIRKLLFPSSEQKSCGYPAPARAQLRSELGPSPGVNTFPPGTPTLLLQPGAAPQLGESAVLQEGIRN